MYSLNNTKFLLDHELEALNNCLNKYRKTNMRDVLLIELALATGARATEILNIKKLDLNIKDKSVLIRGLKGSNDREMPLSDDLFNRLQIFSYGTKDKIFNISYNYFREIWVKYRPVEKRLHSTRHTFAIQLYQRTKDIRLVQFALGHRSLQCTEVYTRYIYQTTELRNLILGA